MNKILLAGSLTLLLVTAAAILALIPGRQGSPVAMASGESQVTRKITVSGTARVYLKPTRVFVELGASTEAASAKEAASANAEVMNRVVDALKALGIGDDDIKTVRYSLQPVYSYSGNKPVLVGYRAINVIEVEVPDASSAGMVIDAATAAGANMVGNIRFGASDEEYREAYLRALEEAAANARAKAQVLANALGVELGPPISVNVGSEHYPRPLVVRAEAKAEAATPVFESELVVAVTVTVVYELQP